MKEVIFKSPLTRDIITFEQLMASNNTVQEVIVLVGNINGCFLITYNDKTKLFTRNPFYFKEKIGLITTKFIDQLTKGLIDPKLYMFDNLSEFLAYAVKNNWR